MELDDLLKKRRKIQNLVLQNEFFIKCMQNKVIPSFIKFRIQKSELKCSPVIEKFFLNDLISKNLKVIKNIKCLYQRNLIETNVWISRLDQLRFLKYLNNIDKKEKLKKFTKHDKSLNYLKKKRFGEVNDNIGNILNLSSKTLNNNEINVLKLGLKFSIPIKQISRESIFSNFESLSAQLNHHVPKSVEAHNSLDAKLCDFAHSYSGTQLDLGDFRMIKDCIKEFKQLKNDKSIIITKPDKGSGVVILNSQDYINKMDNIINDRTKFKHIGCVKSFDATAKVELSFQRKMLRWVKCKYIDTSTYDLIRPVGSQRPKLYGLPKVHKNDCPLRPILSMVGSPQNGLAKFLVKTLTPVLNKFSKYTLKDSFQFVDKLRLIPESQSKNSFMVSYDIKSLFTNIPLIEVIEICLQELYHSDLRHPEMPEFICKEMLHMAVLNVEFSFNNEMYKQIDGVAMGSPLGPILANIFVGYLEHKLFLRSKAPLVYHRYVDDTFVMFKNKIESASFLECLNSLHKNLKFTKEEELNNSLNFLDVCIQRSIDGELSTKIYRKLNSEALYVPWTSFGPTKQKLGVLTGMVKRFTRLCSPCHLEEELKTLQNTFLALGYPGGLISKVITRAKSSSALKMIGPQKCPVYLKLPFLGKVSENFATRISEEVGQVFGSVRLRTVLYTYRPLSGIYKDVSPIQEKSNIIYKFSCHCGSGYVGKTSQRFHLRINQHVPKIIRSWINGTSAQPKKNYFSAIGQHLLDNQVCAKNFKENSFSVVARAENSFQLHILEALYIQSLKPSLCKQKKFVYQTRLFKSLY